MEFLSACATKLVVIAAISSVCELFLGEGRAQKGFDMIIGFLTVCIIADGFTFLLR